VTASAGSENDYPYLRDINGPMTDSCTVALSAWRRKFERTSSTAQRPADTWGRLHRRALVGWHYVLTAQTTARRRHQATPTRSHRRRDRFHTIRQYGGPSPFSGVIKPHDAFNGPRLHFVAALGLAQPAI
jgi:hypothetical protein